MFDPLYVQQAQLLVRCLPEIGRHACFALKGGTAINLFLRPMPRLSVDIDLTYLPLSTLARRWLT
jgi:predicted nucleotidyltransferase component of viral defense system